MTNRTNSVGGITLGAGERVTEAWSRRTDLRFQEDFKVAVKAFQEEMDRMNARSDGDVRNAALQREPQLMEVFLPVQTVPAAFGTNAVPAVAAVLQVTDVQGLISVAETVADQLLVSPGRLQGDGEVRVILKPDVLQGTEIHVVSHDGMVTVDFIPSTADIAALIERNRHVLAQHLAAQFSGTRFRVSVDGRSETRRQT